MLIGLIHKLFTKSVDLTVNLFTFLTAFQITLLHPLIRFEFFLRAEPVVILLLLDPVDRCLIGGRDKLILNSVDLTVNLDALFASSLVLLL